MSHRATRSSACTSRSVDSRALYGKKNLRKKKLLISFFKKIKKK
jgi:hypothetical protein